MIEPEVASGAHYYSLWVIAERHCRPGNRHDLVGIGKTAKGIGARRLSIQYYRRKVLKVGRNAHVANDFNPRPGEFFTGNTGILYAMEVGNVGYICRLHAGGGPACQPEPAAGTSRNNSS